MPRIKRRSNTVATRVAGHRRHLVESGLRRIEVTVPAADARLVRDLAAVLRASGDAARELRRSVAPLLPRRPARSGAELVAFFRASPLVGLDLDFERDKSRGRSIDI